LAAAIQQLFRTQPTIGHGFGLKTREDQDRFRPGLADLVNDFQKMQSMQRREPGAVPLRDQTRLQKISEVFISQ
jgi:hypothetical protein